MLREATAGLDGRLVPALIENVEPPIEFQRLNAVDLSKWHGELPHHEFNQLADSINRVLSSSSIDTSVRPRPESPTPDVTTADGLLLSELHRQSLSRPSGPQAYGTFEADVYISYAHLDNIELIEGWTGWVANLSRALETRLAQRLGRQPVVRWDPKLQGNDCFADALTDQLRSVAVFVSVVSPRYVRSEWTLRELAEFCEAVKRRSDDVSDDARIFKVLKAPVPLEKQPLELQSLAGYELFAVDQDSEKIREFDLASGPGEEGVVRVRLDDLAHDIARRLEHLNSSARVGSPEARKRSAAPLPDPLDSSPCGSAEKSAPSEERKPTSSRHSPSEGLLVRLKDAVKGLLGSRKILTNDPMKTSIPSPLATNSRSDKLASRVLLGVAARREVKKGSTFVARFVAYVEELEQLVRQQLRELERDVDHGDVQAVLGLTPDRGGRWVVGTPVTVRVSGAHVQVEPSTRSFEWNGYENLLSFLVRVEPEAPICTIQLCFEAFIEGVSIAFVPINVNVGAEIDLADAVTATARPLASAFASYSSQDASLVALCLSALKRWDPGLDVFMDCLDLTPNEDWQRELERIIPTKEVFLLFWFNSARDFPWVAWELQEAKSSKGLEWIRPMPIDDPEIAPPPEDLKHLQFRDRYLMARQAFLRQVEKRSDVPLRQHLNR